MQLSPNCVPNTPTSTATPRNGPRSEATVGETRYLAKGTVSLATCAIFQPCAHHIRLPCCSTKITTISLTCTFSRPHMQISTRNITACRGALTSLHSACKNGPAYSLGPASRSSTPRSIAKPSCAAYQHLARCARCPGAQSIGSSTLIAPTSGIGCALISELQEDVIHLPKRQHGQHTVSSTATSSIVPLSSTLHFSAMPAPNRTTLPYTKTSSRIRVMFWSTMPHFEKTIFSMTLVQRLQPLPTLSTTPTPHRVFCSV